MAIIKLCTLSCKLTKIHISQNFEKNIVQLCDMYIFLKENQILRKIKDIIQ